MNLTWFYFHVVLAAIILYKDYDGTLEESLNRFEQKIGLYTEPDTTEPEIIDPPFYIPPIEQDSTEWRDSYRTAELILWDSQYKVLPTSHAVQIRDSRVTAKLRELS